MDGHPGSAGGDLGSADGPGHVLPIEKDATLRIEDHPVGKGPERRAVVEVEVLPHRRERDRAHRRTGVEVGESEAFGHRPRQGGLPGARRAIDGHHERSRRGTGRRSRRSGIRRPGGRRGLSRAPPDEFPEFFDLIVGQLAPAPRREPGVGQAADPGAVQLENRMAEDAQDPADLPVPSAPEGDPQPRAALRFRAVRETGDDLDLVEPQSFAIDPDTALRPLEHIFSGKPADGGVVGLRQPVAGMRDPLRQLPVIGQQHESGAVAIEPADRNQRAERVREQVHHGGTASRVRAGREVSDGLVQNQVAPRLAQPPEARPVHPDVVERGVRTHPGNLHHLTVHGDAALGDHPLRAAPRRDPRGRDQLLEPLGGHSAASPAPDRLAGSGASGASVPPGCGTCTAATSASSNSRSLGRSSSRSSSKRSRKSFVVP